MFRRATLVPVGSDQLPHVDRARVIARRFNRRYAPQQPLFTEPETVLGQALTLLAPTGRG